MVVQKMQVVVQKMQVKPSFSFKPYLSNRRPMGGGCLQSSASKCTRGSYEKMCPMSRKTRIRWPHLFGGLMSRQTVINPDEMGTSCALAGSSSSYSIRHGVTSI